MDARPRSLAGRAPMGDSTAKSGKPMPRNHIPKDSVAAGPARRGPAATESLGMWFLGMGFPDFAVLSPIGALPASERGRASIGNASMIQRLALAMTALLAL